MVPLFRETTITSILMRPLEKELGLRSRTLFQEFRKDPWDQGLGRTDVNVSALGCRI